MAAAGRATAGHRSNLQRCWHVMTVDIIVRSHDIHSHEAHRRAVLRDEGHSHDVLSWSLSDDISKQNYWHNELLLSGSPHATIWRSLTAEAGHSEERRATGDHHRGRDDHFCPLQGDSFSLRPGPSWTRRSNRLAVDRRLTSSRPWLLQPPRRSLLTCASQHLFLYTSWMCSTWKSPATRNSATCWWTARL
jgi:hypothetical protein